METLLPSRARLGPFELDLKAGELLEGGRKIMLQQQPFEVLLMLVERRGGVATREEIRKKLWPNDTVVEFDHAINTAIKKLRKALGDSAENPQYIETVARRGYRLLVPAEWVRMPSDPGSSAGSSPDDSGSAVLSPKPAAFGRNLAEELPLTGKRVSHYRVLEILGGGGMGVVYKAEDLKLGRRVALKFLPEELTGDPVALERFEREARAASALEHPNICPIYEFDEHEGQPFIVMQLLEGQPLREMIAASGGALAIGQLLDLAIQIGEGLEAAHQKGIIHRDIKPANIFITTRGELKILDFGLAKVRGSGTGGQGLGDASAAPDPGPTVPGSLAHSLTRTGVKVGTAAYMSPEQVRGEELDARTDLFSFGLVLYEMATGQQAFSGTTAAVVHEAIVNRNPVPAQQLNRELPANLEAIIDKALQKDRGARYETAAEMRAGLRSVAAGLPREIGESRGAKWRHKSAAAAGVFALLAIVAALYWFSKRQPSPTKALPDVKFRQLTINSSDNPVTSGSISPDGKYLVYVDTQGLHVKTIEGGATQEIPSPEAFKSGSVSWNLPDAAWFPDSTRFIADAHPAGEGPEAWSSRTASVWTFSRQGGAARELRDHAFAASVSPDGSLIPFGTSAGSFGERQVWVMGPNGEQARKLAETEDGSWFGPLRWSPDGGRGFVIRSDESGDTMLSLDLRGGAPVRVFTPTEAKRILSGMRGDVSWLPDGRLIFQLADAEPADTSLRDTCSFWTMRVDPHTGKPAEQPVRLTNWTGVCLSRANPTADGKRFAFLASSGHLTAYVADLEAGGKRVVDTRHFIGDEGDDVIADWSPDSRAVVLDYNRDGQYSLYKQQLNAQKPEPIVAWTPGGLQWALVSPDGKWVITLVGPVMSGPSDLNQVMRVPITGGSPQPMFQVREGSSISCARPPSDLCGVAEQSEDRKQMIITAIDPLKGKGGELARFDLDPDFSPQVSVLVWGISPDGTRLAAAHGLAGPIEIRSLRGQPTQSIRPKGLNHMRLLVWAADGKGFFVTNKTKDGADILHLDLTGSADLIWRSFGERGSHGSQANAFPSPDGRLLAIKDWQQSANIWMMENF